MSATPHRPLPLRQRLALAAEVLATYATVYRLLRRVDLDSLVARLREDARARPARRVRDVEPFRLAHIVVRILTKLPTDSRCLMRSLTLVQTLARRGIDTRLVIAVAPGERFAAHAWVELDAEPLLPTGGGRFQRLHET